MRTLMQCDWMQVSRKHLCQVLCSGCSTLPVSCFQLSLPYPLKALSVGTASKARDGVKRELSLGLESFTLSDHPVARLCVLLFQHLHALPWLFLYINFWTCYCALSSAACDWWVVYSVCLTLNFKAAHTLPSCFLSLTQNNRLLWVGRALNVDSTIRLVGQGGMVLGSLKASLLLLRLSSHME